VRRFQGREGVGAFYRRRHRPRWRRDGKELFYFSGGKLMAVDVKASESSFEPGPPRLLFEKSGISNYDVNKTGSNSDRCSRRELAEPITVVLNWTADRNGEIQSKSAIYIRQSARFEC